MGSAVVFGNGDRLCDLLPEDSFGTVQLAFSRGTAFAGLSVSLELTCIGEFFNCLAQLLKNRLHLFPLFLVAIGRGTYFLNQNLLLLPELFQLGLLLQNLGLKLDITTEVFHRAVKIIKLRDGARTFFSF